MSHIVFNGNSTISNPYFHSGIWEWDVTKLPNWWRCEACRCAVSFRVENKLQLKCPECGAPIPEKYDTL